MSEREKPANVEFALSNQMILDVVREYEDEHPGQDGWKMDSKEFADRMMKKVAASARVIVGGNA